MDSALDKKIFRKKIFIVVSITFILGLVSFIAVHVNKANVKYKNELNKITISAQRWGKDNIDKLPKNHDEVYYLSLETLINDKYYKRGSVKTPITNKKIDACISIAYDTIAHKYHYNLSETYCKDYKYTVYKDKSGANTPILSDNMVPVIYKDDKWVKADITKRWYDYTNNEWANMVLVRENGKNSREYYLSEDSINKEVLMDDILAFYVWVPRFKYQLWNVNGDVEDFKSINVIFEYENATTGLGTKNGEWLTHPAFCLGNVGDDRTECSESEVNGLWVGKFETTGDNRMPTVLPNENPITTYNLSTDYTLVRKMISNNYGLTSKNYLHIMKNMDWGAVVYLTYSKYGYNTEPFINNNSNLVTGCSASSPTSNAYEGCLYQYNSVVGVKASTTGNITGIYDMNGGASEIVMGVLLNGKGREYKGASKFKSNISKSLYNGYDDASYESGMLGDATKEFTYNGKSTKGTAVLFVSAKQPWFIRGGFYDSGYEAGITSYSSSDGDYSNAFRTALVGY